jgi:hypothetical protein
MSGSRWWWLAAASAALAVTVVVVALLHYAAPSRVEFDGRDYGQPRAQSGRPQEDRAVGHTTGGDLVFGYPTDGTQLVIWVRHHGRWHEYVLLGGP